MYPMALRYGYLHTPKSIGWPRHIYQIQEPSTISVHIMGMFQDGVLGWEQLVELEY